ncbi:MAG: hypothetical protein ACSLFP_18620 [Acidimicrobiales bacterium]
MSEATPDRQPRGFWVGLALGVPVMAVGVVGALDNAGRAHPGELARWVVGSALVHDAVVLPVVLALGWVAHRTTPAPAWPAVRWALATTGVIALVAWPFVRGYGRRAANPSLLPRDYALGTVAAVAAVWAVAAAWAWLGWRRGRLRR